MKCEFHIHHCASMWKLKTPLDEMEDKTKWGGNRVYYIKQIIPKFVIIQKHSHLRFPPMDEKAHTLLAL